MQYILSVSMRIFTPFITYMRIRRVAVTRAVLAIFRGQTPAYP